MANFRKLKIHSKYKQRSWRYITVPEIRLEGKWLNKLGFVEGMSYLVLLALCMPLKYLYDIPEPTSYIGMAHGVLFVAYCIWVFIVGFEKRWAFMTTFWALFASLVPFGTFVADKHIFSMQ